MTNKEIMAEPLQLLKAFKEAIGKARLEIKKKALAETVHETSSKTIDRFFAHDSDLASMSLLLGWDLQKLAKVSDDGEKWTDYNENGEKL